MKWSVVPILLFLAGLLTFDKVFIVLQHQLNKNYIAAELCVNKAKPKLNCKGSCQLKKQLSQQEEQQPVRSADISTNLDNILYFESYSNPHPALNEFTGVDYAVLPPDFYSSVPEARHFHPPSLG